MKVDPAPAQVARDIDREHGPPQPIFVLSLPRSGSTLIQRAIASHEGVATASEPWLMLPLLAAIRPDIPISGPWERSVAAAVHDFAAGSASGRENYLEVSAMRLFASINTWPVRALPTSSTSRRPTTGSPRDLFEAFPDGKFVFLWRNPLSVLSSIVETLCGGRWGLHRFRGVLFHGMENLVAAHRSFAGRAVAVRYEDLVLGGDAEWRRLTEYIGIDFSPASLASFSGSTSTGSSATLLVRGVTTRISDEPLDKWRETICNPLRKEWADRYLRWIGSERLSDMGYELDDLRGQLADLNVGAARISADTLDLSAAALREMLVARRRGGPASASRLLLGHRR